MGLSETIGNILQRIRNHRSTIALYIVTLLLLVLMKRFLKAATLEQMKALLAPVACAVRLFLASPFELGPAGYFYPELHIIIGKSCSGANFFLVLFALLVFLYVPTAKGVWRKVLYWGEALILSYFVTLAANASRILMAVSMRSYFAGTGVQDKFHMILGMVVYLFYLVLTRLMADKLMRKAGNGS
ncbi:MAG TPA: exosortase K [Bacillota bacterium]|nr:exosortase K [Bacillota bacterium]